MDKLPLTSQDVLAEKIDLMRAEFPEVFVEGKIDFERLKMALGEFVDNSRERFGLTWSGKGEAIRNIQTPSQGTLLPVPEQSVHFETSENLILEGDNLEILKILQKSYHGKIKMIYIDPPYNTGNEFIYKDNYHVSLNDYLRYSGQVDGAGFKLSTTVDTDGRYHSKWLNMMYPRLFLSRNLLTDDGIIFISIDEIEVAKLRLICDEIFGEENHIADLVWQNKKGGGNDAKYVAVEHEYIVMYAKNELALHHLFEPYKPEYLQRYKEQDTQGKFYWDTFKRKSGKQYYPITCPDKTVLQFDEYGNPISWLRSEERFKSDVEQGEIKFVRVSNKWSVHFKQRLPQGKKPRSIFFQESIITDKGTTSAGSGQLLQLFADNVFPNPKPVDLIKHLIGFSTQAEDYILDFFAGSGTTGQAVLEMNRETGSKRKFVMVQIPEPIPNPDFPTLTELMKERMRRVLSLHQAVEGIGFRVFKLSSSNFKLWNPAVADKERLEVQLRLFVNNVVEGRTALDLVYEVVLKSGLPLDVQVAAVHIGEAVVYVVDQGLLMVCLQSAVTPGLIQWIVEQRPLQLVCLDRAFMGRDSFKSSVKVELESQGIEFRTI
ncbi:site-specific DNA-methyltransferase [Alicyclobacillaceae bacterium I2511]|nr:site-specific DNA-methyltransferase [Alicyclobacillaceae bacterium I2511]